VRRHVAALKAPTCPRTPNSPSFAIICVIRGHLFVNSCPFVVRMTTGRNIRFWRNVTLIALAHVALIVGLIRWSVAARASTNAESIVWLGSAEDLAAREHEEGPSTHRESQAIEPKPLNDDEAEKEKTVITTAKSEIELPSPTPKPTPKPKPSSTPTPKPKVTPKPTPKPALKKVLLAKASPKPVLKTKPSSAKSSEKSDKNEKTVTAKTGTAQSGSGKTGSTGKGSSAGGGSSASEFGWYGHMLHDRFYSGWIQPTTSVPSGSKISTLVKLRIEKDGRVSKFEIIKPSENVVVNESVAAIAKRVTEVDAPPTGLIKGDHYDVKINFELNTEEGAPK
jgi:outer membrane biosynthesis protein TonB